MIALLTTYFLVFYILIPGILFRFASSLRVRLKLFQRTRTQEATFAVAVALLPFALALASVWYLPGMRQFPFPVSKTTLLERRQDYHRVAGLFLSSDSAKSAAASSPQPAEDPTWPALNRVLRRQGRFLSWYFLLTLGEGWLFGYLASKYGDWKITAQGSNKRRRTFLPIRFYNWMAPIFILPNISEWHMLLTNFSWPKHEQIFVVVDILQNDGIIYKGRVSDYFVDFEGKLTGILLENVTRFDRQAYLEARTSATDDKPVSAESYWKTIPSQRFYIGQSSIANLNVRFVPRDEMLISFAEQILDEHDSNTYDVVVESADDTDQQQPDLYS